MKTRQSEEKPQIRRENGEIIIDSVRLEIYPGMCMTPAYHIVKQSRKYEENATLELIEGCDKEDIGKRANTKSMMEMMTLCASKNTILKIRVSGTTEEAEKLALRLYSGLTTNVEEREIKEEDFYRYE
jgi:phosphotransferase system HPr-like phosphotransfer protein